MQPGQQETYYGPTDATGAPTTTAPGVTTMAGGETDTPGKKHSIKETVTRYIDEVKADLQRKKASHKSKHAASDSTRAQEQGELPQYDIYGIGSNQNQGDAAEDGRSQGMYAQPGAVGPAKLLYPTIVPIETIRISLDKEGQPELARIAVKYDNISKTYNAAIVDDPAVCQISGGERRHEFATLPRYVQFRVKDTLGRDTMLYSNTYCRVCGVHSLSTKI